MIVSRTGGLFVGLTLSGAEEKSIHRCSYNTIRTINLWLNREHPGLGWPATTRPRIHRTGRYLSHGHSRRRSPGQTQQLWGTGRSAFSAPICRPRLAQGIEFSRSRINFQRPTIKFRERNTYCWLSDVAELHIEVVTNKINARGKWLSRLRTKAYVGMPREATETTWGKTSSYWKAGKFSIEKRGHRGRGKGKPYCFRHSEFLRSCHCRCIHTRMYIYICRNPRQLQYIHMHVERVWILYKVCIPERERDGAMCNVYGGRMSNTLYIEQPVGGLSIRGGWRTKRQSRTFDLEWNGKIFLVTQRGENCWQKIAYSANKVTFEDAVAVDCLRRL